MSAAMQIFRNEEDLDKMLRERTESVAKKAGFEKQGKAWSMKGTMLRIAKDGSWEARGKDDKTVDGSSAVFLQMYLRQQDAYKKSLATDAAPMQLDPAEVDAAGVVIQEKGGKVLFLLRGPDSDHEPNTWCFPAGRSEPGESAFETASRECWEETGFEPPGLVLLDSTPDFCTFLCRNVEKFEPHDSTNEHRRYAWADPSDPPQPLHSGCGNTLDVLMEGD